ncbi:unnamed protein product [Rotaria sordida]|uniref:Uncharacterized protein n=1 Tax=Rotaria sordida TaxID=392033 RepID=A0A815RXZ3_9BILA|nr:unnamed protein product [Rotaria sordida]CAF1649402.1 unnamed protein product [Rotaria sordida]
MSTTANIQTICLYVTIQNVDISITNTDIENGIRPIIDTDLPYIYFGKPYNIENTKQRKVYLKFPDEQILNEFTKNRLIQVRDKQIHMSPFNPQNIQLSDQMSHFLLIRISETHSNGKTLKDLTQFDINEYFKSFGQIVSCPWRKNFEAVLELQ